MNLIQKRCNYDALGKYSIDTGNVHTKGVAPSDSAGRRFTGKVRLHMKKYRKITCLAAALLVFFTAVPTAQAKEGNNETKNKTLAPYFYVEAKDSSTDRFPLKETNVTADISGMIADIRVVQTYANEGENPISASYIFPASTKVTVHGMTMQIGNQRVTAQIKEKEEAAKEFEEAKSEGKSASLLSEVRSNVFRMNVANIMPGDVCRIELHYTELISPSEGTYQFVFPTVTGPRYVGPVTDDTGNREEWTEMAYLPEGSVPEGKYNIQVNLSAGVPITALTSDSHKINIAWNENTAAQITLSDPSDYAGNRDFILDYSLSGKEISSGLIVNEGKEENFFLLMLQPPERVTKAEILPREYVFVLDVSGSMSGYPLDTAKELIRDLVSHLNSNDTFNLILFSGAAYQLSEESLPATDRNIKRAIRVIDNQSGGGGTELAPALKAAMEIPSEGDRNRSIVVITDGYISGETEIFDMIEGNQGKADFFAFGIGSAVNRYLVEGIAKTGQGEPFVVTEEEEAAKTAQQFRTYIQSPVLTDIQVSFGEFEAYDVEPAVLPTLYAQKPIILLGKYKGEAKGEIQIKGKTGAGEYSAVVSAKEVIPAENKEALRYLWARNRVDRLTDYGANKNDESVKAEVTKLGLTYQMMTPYTSFVAVLDTVRNTEGESTDVNQPNVLPLGVSNLAVSGYTVGSEPEVLVLVAAVLGIALLQRGKRRRRIQA